MTIVSEYRYSRCHTLLEWINVFFGDLSAVEPHYVDTRLSLEVVTMNFCDEIFVHNNAPRYGCSILWKVLRKMSECAQWFWGV